MKSLELKLPIIAAAFLLMGLFADVLPHPALGPGLIQSGLEAVFPEEDNAPQIAGSDLPVNLGQMSQEFSD